MNKITYWDYSMKYEIRSAIDIKNIDAINTKKEFEDDKIFREFINDPRHEYFKLIKKILGYDIYGTVLEIGAGNGILTCKMAKIKGVKKIYALDYSKNCVEVLMLFIIKNFNLNVTEENLIFPVVGSFNDIKLPDNSIDFVVAWGSFHHSEDRERTLKEIYRVLKVNGYLIALDKAHTNTYTNRMLDIELNPEYDVSSLNGFDPSKKYTRKMNSEHFPILAEWEYFLAKCGFYNKIFLFQNKFRGKFGWIWQKFGKLFFKIFGDYMIRRGINYYYFIKIPYYPWFSKVTISNNILIGSRKEPYVKMP